MKREYFGMLFILVLFCSTLEVDYFFGEEKFANYLSKYIVVWVLTGFYAGQYSLRFPKGF